MQAGGAGVDPGLETLFIDERPRLHRLCRGLLGDDRDAEDAVQEAFVRAARHLPGTDDPIAYLVVVARHVCYEELRRRRCRDAPRPLAPVPPGLDPEQLVIERDLIGQALQDLSGFDRVALANAAAGRSLSETAERLGTSVDAAAQRLSRARRRLRQAVAWGRALVVLPVAHLRARTAALPRLQHLEGAAAPLLVAVIAGTAAVTPVAVRGGAATPAVPPSSLTHALPQAQALPADTTHAATDSGAPTAVRTGSGVQSSPSPPAVATHVSTGPGDPLTRSEATSFTPSPSYASDHTVYASTSPTVSPCPGTTCATLLRSRDAGRSWTVLGQFGGGPVLLPPSFPQQPRLFAVNAAGLEQSDDSGSTFRRVVPLSASPGFTPEAVIDLASPAGDPQVVVTATASSLLTYDAAGGRAAPGPVLPPSTQRIDALLAAPGGGVYVDAESVGGGAMYLCTAGGCTSAGPWVPGSPVLSPTFATDHTLFSAPGGQVIVTRIDGSERHTLAEADPVSRLLPAVDYATSARLDILVQHQQDGGGWQPQLLESTGGAAFQPSAARPWDVPMDASTVTLLPDGELIAGLAAHSGPDGPYGIAWSADGGRTWSEGG
jgi:RNA polymerase sigma factor (sigma-70 family)